MQIGENAVLLDLLLQQPGCLSGQEKIMELPIAAGGAVGRDHDLAGGVDTVEHPDIVPAIARQGLYHDGAADGVEEAGETRQVAQRLLALRSEEHTSALQSLMRTSYAVFCSNTIHTKSTRVNDRQ